MDDRIEHSGDSAATTRSAFGRREMLQRTGFVVGAAALWTTPLVKSISASASEVSPYTRGLCEDGPAGNEQKPTRLCFKVRNDDVSTYKPGCTDEELTYFPPLNQDDNYTEQDNPTVGTCGPTSKDARVTIEGTVYDVNFDVLFCYGSGPLPSEVYYTVCVGGVSYSAELHTSCSRTLCIGDRFGPLELVGAEVGSGATFGETD